MPESDALPPGWEERPLGCRDHTQQVRDLGPYQLRVWQVGAQWSASVYLEIPWGELGLTRHGHRTSENARRKALSLARELAAWRPPALPHTGGEDDAD